MKILVIFTFLILVVILSGCSNPKKMKYIFPNEYEGYHVFIESSDADELDSNGRMTTIIVPEGRISFVPSFSLFREWHVMEAERKNGSRILVENSNLDPDTIRLYSFGDSGVLLNGVMREGHYIFLGNSENYESFREYKVRNNLDPNVNAEVKLR